METDRTELLNLYCSARDLQTRTRDSSDIAGHWSVDGHTRRVNVAVVDTGFDRSPILLANALAPGSGFTTSGPGWLGYRSVSRSEGTDERPVVRWVDDRILGACRIETSVTSHGTHVAGIVALVVGGSLKERYRIVPMAIGDKGCQTGPVPERRDCEIANPHNHPGLNAVKALQDLASPAYRDVLVVNISWSFDFTNQATQKALLNLTAQGKLLVISAGNDDRVLSHNPQLIALVHLARLAQGRLIIVGSTEAYTRRTLFWDRATGRPIYELRPRSHSEAYLDAVGRFSGVTAPATYAGEWIAPYSNYPGKDQPEHGWFPQSVFICAPGSGVLSTVPRQTQFDGLGIAHKDGTSMAAPVVTGLLAKALICFPHLSVDEVRHLLFETADGTRRPSLHGAGTVNADRFREAATRLNTLFAWALGTYPGLTIEEVRSLPSKIEGENRR